MMETCPPAQVPSLRAPLPGMAPSSSLSVGVESEDQQFFDSRYPRGQVHIFPQLYPSKVKVFKPTEEEAPDNPDIPTLPEQLGVVITVDEKKLDNAMDRRKGEGAEIRVIKLLQGGFEKRAEPTGLACFILFDLDQKTYETDILILHDKLGVLLFEVKSVSNPKNLSQVSKAAVQLTSLKEKVLEKLQDLLGADAVRAVICLPNLKLDQIRDSPKIATIKEKNPHVEFLCGQESDEYQAWVMGLTAPPAPAVWNSRSDLGDPHKTFRQAVERYLKEIPRASPRELLKQLAGAHCKWVITERQTAVLDDSARLLHIWGPPGAGKTLLLIRKARQRLGEGWAVLLHVGHLDYDVLLSHLGKSVLSKLEGSVVNRLHFCCEYSNMRSALEAMRRTVGPDEICIIVDELSYETLQSLVDLVKSGEVAAVCTASVTDLKNISTRLEEDAQNLGWTNQELHGSFRCPDYIVEVLNHLLQGSKSKSHIHIAPSAIPAAVTFHATKMINHRSHVNSKPASKTRLVLDCVLCNQELVEILDSLMKDLFEHWVLLGTGEIGYDDEATAELVRWLRQLGMPVVWEKRNSRSNVVTPASLSSNVLDMEEVAAWRRRVLAGKDEQGRPVVHGLKNVDFVGLEKPGVILVHWDPLDDDPDFQSQEEVEDRLADHSDQWMRAASRCQGQLVVLLLSPSPAFNHLPSSGPSAR